jgi:hypothetical protein
MKRCWIVCVESNDLIEYGQPTGMVFLNEAQAKEYIAGRKGLFLERGYINQEEETP